MDLADDEVVFLLYCFLPISVTVLYVYSFVTGIILFCLF